MADARYTNWTNSSELRKSYTQLRCAGICSECHKKNLSCFSVAIISHIKTKIKWWFFCRNYCHCTRFVGVIYKCYRCLFLTHNIAMHHFVSLSRFSFLNFTSFHTHQFVIFIITTLITPTVFPLRWKLIWSTNHSHNSCLLSHRTDFTASWQRFGLFSAQRCFALVSARCESEAVYMYFTDVLSFVFFHQTCNLPAHRADLHQKYIRSSVRYFAHPSTNFYKT